MIRLSLALALGLAALLGWRSADAQAARYYGFYRGIVTVAIDPLQQGRVMVSVPSVPGPLGWAVPAVPYPQKATGKKIPLVGTTVWVTFEAGDPNYPIWVGWLGR